MGDVESTKAGMGIGTLGVMVGVLALVGMAVASTLAWRNQSDAEASMATLTELQARWTLAQRDLEATTAELESMKAEGAQYDDARKRTEVELADLGAQVERLEKELATLRRQLRAPAKAKATPKLPEDAPELAEVTALPILDEALLEELDNEDGGTPPLAKLAPTNPFVFPDSAADGPKPAVLVPRSPDAAPSAFLVPTPDAPPAATLTPSAPTTTP